MTAGTRDRNLPANLKLRAPGKAYDQDEMAQAFRVIEQHYHLQLIPGTSSGFATVLLPLDGGLDVLVDAQWVTAVITFDYEIVGYRVIEDCDLSGSLVMKVEYADNAAFPTFTEISGSDRPTITAGHASESTALTGWTTSGVANSQLRAVMVGNATDITRAVLAIALRKL